MKISAKKQTELYRAIAEEVMDYRIQVNQGVIKIENVETDLFYLQNRIWKNVANVLGIEV